MLKFSLPIALALAIVAGCTHVDPNKARPVTLNRAETKVLTKAVTHDFGNPKNVAFRNLRVRDNYYPDGTVIRSVCGEIKGQGVVGGEDGFLGFTRNFENGRWVVPVIGQPCW